jgi:hypothetical protein
MGRILRRDPECRSAASDAGGRDRDPVRFFDRRVAPLQGSLRNGYDDRSRMKIAVLVFASCSTLVTTGSIVREPCLHVGVRPASDGIGDYAATIQVSFDAPCTTRPDAGAKP